MTSGADEIKASMNTEINLLGSSRLLLLEHIRLVLIVEEFDDRLPGVPIVHIVAKTWGINNRQAD